jgi:hypothetical protein
MRLRYDILIRGPAVGTRASSVTAHTSVVMPALVAGLRVFFVLAS